MWTSVSSGRLSRIEWPGSALYASDAASRIPPSWWYRSCLDQDGGGGDGKKAEDRIGVKFIRADRATNTDLSGEIKPSADASLLPHRW